MAAADSPSTWSDQRLTAELRAILGRLDPCVACGCDVSMSAVAVFDGAASGQTELLPACPSCGEPIALLAAQG